MSWLVVRDQATYYFTELLGDARRVGPIGTSFNQSWRGGISRIVGHDAGYGAPVLAALAVTAVLAWLSAHGHRVTHISSGRAGLETLFLALTGRQLRDE